MGETEAHNAKNITRAPRHLSTYEEAALLRGVAGIQAGDLWVQECPGWETAVAALEAGLPRLFPSAAGTAGRG